MKRISIGLSAAAAASLSACATIPGIPAQADQNLIDGAWPYALMAYNSYHREEGAAASPRFALPERFQLLKPGKNDPYGLAYDVYRELRSEGPHTVFVFRGTENRKGPKAPRQTNCDWKYGNFSLVQHDRAIAAINAYLAQNPIATDRLIFVGHSLGGGLAIHATYRYPGSWAYVFDSSPRFRKPKGYAPSATDRYPFRRTSIAQRLEVLKITRIPAREANQFYLPVECVKGGVVDRHAMRPLAICLTRIAAGGGSGAIAAEAYSTVRRNPELFSYNPPPDEALEPPTCGKG